MTISRKFAVVVAVSILAVVAVPLHASHAWSTYHWARTSNPFTLKIGKNMTSGWTSALNTAVSDWDQSSVMNLSLIHI